MNKGSIYLIPTYLSDGNENSFIADDVKAAISKIDYYAVENIRSARRFISSLNLDLDIAEINFQKVDKHFRPDEIEEITSSLFEGHDLGILSESGLPGIADPGGLLVEFAHKNEIQVKTLSGSSSIILALISSGFNGQQFTFHGYLPIDKAERSKSIGDLYDKAMRSGYTQLFMETPYRNQQMLENLKNKLPSSAMLYVGYDLTGPLEFSLTKSIKEWRENNIAIPKIPSVFGIGI